MESGQRGPSGLVDAKALSDSHQRTSPPYRLSTAQVSGSTTYGGYSQKSYAYNNAGNLTSFEGATFAYNDAAHKHGVTHIGGVQKYWYDQNGNVTQRTSPWGTTIALAYNAENLSLIHI